MTHRVAITGIGFASPIGHTLEAVADCLQNDRHGISIIDEWEEIGQLQTRLAGRISDLTLTGRWSRKKIRTMGRVSLLATHASDAAIEMADLSQERLTSGRVGLAYGSTHGSTNEVEDY